MTFDKSLNQKSCYVLSNEISSVPTDYSVDFVVIVIFFVLKCANNCMCSTISELRYRTVPVPVLLVVTFCDYGIIPKHTNSESVSTAYSTTLLIRVVDFQFVSK